MPIDSPSRKAIVRTVGIAALVAAILAFALFLAFVEAERSEQTSNAYMHSIVGTVESVDARSNTLVVSAENREESEFPEDPVTFTIDRSNWVVDDFEAGDLVKVYYFWPCGSEGDRKGKMVVPA